MNGDTKPGDTKNDIHPPGKSPRWPGSVGRSLAYLVKTGKPGRWWCYLAPSLVLEVWVLALML